MSDVMEELIYTGNKLSLKYLDVLIKQNEWKAFATIHAGIHHQMRIILVYKFNKNEKGKPLGNHLEKWKIIYDKTFYKIANDLFVVGVITKKFKEKILKFNTDRNKKLGHINIYQKRSEPSETEIRQICLEGLSIIKKLDKIINDIFFPKK